MSKEKLLLVGAGGFGRMVAEQAMLQYDCAFVDDGQAVGAEICGVPVAGGTADLPELRKECGLLVVGVGNNQFRSRMYEKAKEDHTFRTDIPKKEFFRVTVHTMMTACTYCASGFIWGSEDNKDYTSELLRIKEMILNYAKISE